MNRTEYTDLTSALEAAAPGGVAARASDLLAHAHDASHYLLTPRAVVAPQNPEQVAALLRASESTGVPLTFRSGGTSLSGQASSEGILVDTRRYFREVEVLDNGKRVRAQPGATVRSVNARLSRHHRRLGPDPASEIACTIGGVIANNSSGMCCGVHDNSYRTLDSAVLVLPSGTVLDTAVADADEQLHDREPEIHQGLIALRDRVRGNPDSVATIERLFAIKNTMGYGVNSFLDHDRPVDILQHLVVGSEGTLAFVAEATFRTVAVRPHVATGLLVFDDLADANRALPDLVAGGFAAIELLDATSLKVSQRDPEATGELAALTVRDHAALLVEYAEHTEAELDAAVTAGQALLDVLPLARPAALSGDHTERARLWHIRKGLFAAVAGNRPSGTTALLEDIAVPVESLLATCQDLTVLFDQHGYRDSVIFGHAKDGNIHFLLNERFDQQKTLDRYVAFTDDLVDLVLGRGGTLKAEHGTGRTMAPFVRRQYGDELYDVMRSVKQLLDPKGRLNPGVLLNDDPDAHIRNLKTTPTIEAEVDRCVECGYCEPACPSKDLTLTPRQRIVLRREIVRAERDGNHALRQQLEVEYEYDGVQTCAVDGMCETACPVLINTGDLVRRLRAEQITRVDRTVWLTGARHWDRATRLTSGALTAAHSVPPSLASATSKVARTVLGSDRVPLWSSDLPRGGTPRLSGSGRAPQAVYFSSCTTTMFGPATMGVGVRNAFLTLCERADVAIRIPEEIASLCCATPWKSKGVEAGYAHMRALVEPALWAATERGRLPIVSDASSCTEGLAHLLDSPGRKFQVLDVVEFVDTVLLPQLPRPQRLSSLAVHPTCSTTRLRINESVLRVAGVIADRVIVPDDWSCCGFAGDRGMLHPELTSAATAPEAKAVRAQGCAAHVSVNRTCEIGMTRATGHPYRHVVELLEELTR